MTAQLILIAGPYRSGTDGKQALIDANLQRLEAAALAVYQRGHIPLIGEWLALPLAKAAGSTSLDDEISEAMLYPVAHRLITRCDAIYRIAGSLKVPTWISRSLVSMVWQSILRSTTFHRTDQKSCRYQYTNNICTLIAVWQKLAIVNVALPQIFTSNAYTPAFPHQNVLHFDK